MFLTSDIISKPVLNLYSGKIEGTICDIILNATYSKIQKLKMFDDDEEEYLIETNRIYSIGKNVVVIKNNTALDLILTDTYETNNNIIGKEVFSTSGESVGKIKDIEFNEKFLVENIKCENKSFKTPQILNNAEKIIVNLDNSKIKMKDIRPKMVAKSKMEDKKVYVLPRIEAKVEDENPNQNSKVYKIDGTFSPQKVVGNTKFLIGRKVLKTIYGINNEVIVKKDSIINAKNIEYAKMHSKLNELTLYSKAKA